MNEDFRKVAPTPLEAIPFNVPKPFQTELSNGLRIVIIEDKRHPLINFRLAFPTGDIYDPNDGIGVTSAMASMLNEGTQLHSSKQLAQEIEKLGASLGVSAGMDNTIVKANTLSIYRTEVLKLIAEIVLTPSFPEDELELYKQNAIEGLKYQRSQPDFLADEQCSRILYGEHPYSINSPSEEDFKKLTREQLVTQHAKLFIPNNAIFIIVGDVESESLIREIEELFGEWQQGEIENPAFPEFPIREKRTLTIVDRPGSTQSNIVLTNLGINQNHPDYFPILLMNQILGAGASSRLFMNLREEKGYTYGAYSRIYAKRLGGAFEATSEVRTSVTGDSLKEFFFELNRIRDEKVSDEELQDAKNYLTGVFPIRAETQSGLTGLIVSQFLYGLPEDYLETYRDKVNAVTMDEVERVANQYVLSDKLAMVIVGDAEEIIPQAKSYADEIEIFDANNNKKELSEYMTDENVETANVAGSWKLTVEAMGQTVDLSLNLVQDGENVTGNLDSMLGAGEISEGKLNGNKLSAVANLQFQGQPLDIGLKATFDGDLITGTLNAPMLPMPYEFKGNKI